MLLTLTQEGDKHKVNTFFTQQRPVTLSSHYQQEQILLFTLKFLLVPTTGSVPVPNEKLRMLPCQRRVQTAFYVSYFTLDMSLGFEPVASDTQDIPREVQEETVGDRKQLTGKGSRVRGRLEAGGLTFKTWRDPPNRKVGWDVRMEINLMFSRLSS